MYSEKCNNILLHLTCNPPVEIEDHYLRSSHRNIIIFLIGEAIYSIGRTISWPRIKNLFPRLNLWAAHINVTQLCSARSTWRCHHQAFGAALFSRRSERSAQMVLLFTFLRIFTFSFYTHNVCTIYLQIWGSWILIRRDKSICFQQSFWEKSCTNILRCFLVLIPQLYIFLRTSTLKIKLRKGVQYGTFNTNV